MWHLKPALLVGSAVFAAFSLLVGKSHAKSGNGAAETVMKRARVKPNDSGGMNTRAAPRLDAQLVPDNDAYSGTTVDVLQIGIAPTDGSGGEWWRIMTPGGSVGYARAVDPQGVHNFEDI